MNPSSATNIASHLPLMAERQPDTLAVVVPHEQAAQRTYRQLNEESDRLARGLTAIGIGRGVRTVLMVQPGLEFFALTFALFKAGAVPVMIDPGMGIKNTYGIQPRGIVLPTFPLFALFAPALGMTAVIPDMDFTRPGQVDPEKILTAIEEFRVTNLFGSPALIDRVGRYGAERKTKLPILRRVISAGAPVAAETLKRFSQLLNPGIQIFTP